jgi:hypothetical protein
MADNVAITPGTGATVLTDELVDGVLGTGHAQFIKIMDGPLGGSAKAGVGAQDDAVSAPSGLFTAGFVSFYNGTTWDRARGDTTHGLDVDVTRIPVHASGDLANSATSLALLDDAIFVDDVAFTPATSKVMVAGFLADELATDSVDEGDVGVARMTRDRKLHAVSVLESSEMRASGLFVQPKFATITAGASGSTEVVAAVPTKKIRALRFTVSASGAIDVRFLSGTANRTGTHFLAAQGGWVENYCPVGVFETASGEALNIRLSANGGVGGSLTYIEV